MNRKYLVVLVVSLLLPMSDLMVSGACAAPAGSVLPLSPVSEQNAVRTASDYLRVGGFSRTGLIEQLEYEGYSTEDATFAVDSIDVDWYEQAAKVAKDYLKTSGFSRSALVDQLEYDGFSAAQAEYGVDSAGY